MKIIKDNLYIPFLDFKNIYLAVSGLLMLAIVVAYFAIGLNYGIDFKGGTVIQLEFEEPVDIEPLRGYFNQPELGEVLVQRFGSIDENSVLITLGATIQQLQIEGEELEDYVSNNLPNATIARIESVGAKVGGELRSSAQKAVLMALVAIGLYIWLRFGWRFGAASLIALIHDVLMALAVLIVARIDVSLPVVAAILTVGGYSINDTMVIFDRIREHQRLPSKKKLDEIINISLSNTLSRTLITSGTTLLVLGSMLIFGGELIRDFAIVLTAGVIVGTYSSLFIAAPLAYLFAKETKATNHVATKAVTAKAK